ncbi:hypothetical protein ACHHYP_05460 [Achlya hypogyna]|uniref:Uncharacterized protein n=1 Tax=Achlya hypogyna TaxID=1202772 RepID=A0A1V9YXU0_ACHHY|nr:hypothetical protein ACHHYP_05460 [Achlya hypogyna]
MTTAFAQPVKLPGAEWTGSESERSSTHVRRRAESTARPPNLTRVRSDGGSLRGLVGFTRGRSMSLPVDDIPVDSSDELLIDIDTPVSKCMIYTTQVLDRTHSSGEDHNSDGDDEYAPRPTETWLDEVLNSKNPVTHRSTATLEAPLSVNERVAIVGGPKNLTSNRSRGLSLAGRDMAPRHGISPARVGGGDTSLRLNAKSTALLNFPRNTRRAVGATVGSSLGQTLVNSTPEPSMTPSLSFDGSSVQKKVALDEMSASDNSGSTRTSLFDFGAKKTASEPKKPNPVAVALEKICAKEKSDVPSSPAKKDKGGKKWWELSKHKGPPEEKKPPTLSEPDPAAVPKKSILVATPPTPTCLTPQSFDDFDDDVEEEDHSIFSSLRNVDLVSSYVRDSASKDADMEADAAKAVESSDEDDESPPEPTPTPAAALPPAVLKPMPKAARGNANMVAFLGGYKQSQGTRGMLKLGVASDIASRAKNIRKRTAETALQRKLAEAKARIPAEWQDMSGVVLKDKRNKSRRVVFLPDEALEDIYVFEVVDPEPEADDDGRHTLVDL